MAERYQTKSEGIFYKLIKKRPGPGKEKSFYAAYWKDGRYVEASIGKESQGMNEKQAVIQRAKLMLGQAMTKKEAKAKAEEEAAQARAAQEQARRQEAARPTMGKLWEEFKTAKADKKSLNSEEGRWNLHISSFLAHKEPGELVTLDVQRINKAMIEKGLSVMTRKHCLVLIKRIIAHAVDMGRIDPPYSKEFKIDLKKLVGKVNNETTEDLNEEQLHKLLEAIQEAPASDRQGADCMRLALCTGMRKSEIYKLRWDEVSFDRGNIRITDPKGGEDATIPLNSTARAILEGIPREENSPWIFPGKDSKKHVVCLKRQINRIRQAAGLPEGFRPMHGLRHAFACSLISSGKVDLPTLQKLLTHKSPEMTLRYAKVRNDRLNSASSVMDDILTQAQAPAKPGKVIDLEAARSA